MKHMTRRGLMAVGGLAAGIAGLAGSAPLTRARASAASDNANLKLVVDFYHAQNHATDIGALLRSYLAQDCKVHTVGLSIETSVVVGPAALAVRWAGFLERYQAERFANQILSTWAKGPFVMIEHTNVIVGGPKRGDTPTSPMVSTFMVEHGIKIRDWTDYPLI